MTDNPRVRALADRAAIQDVVARYFAGLDRQDFDRVASCFTSDVVADYRGRVLEGVDALVDITRGVRRYAVTTHFMGNYLVEVRGDTATAETYATDHLRIMQSGEEADMSHGLRYYDELVRKDGQWLISRRAMTSEWSRVDPVAPAPGG